MKDMSTKEYFRDRLFCLKDSHQQYLELSQTTIPAPSLYSGMRSWVRFFRENGLSKLHALKVQAEDCNGFFYLLLACLWEGVSLVIVDESTLKHPDCEGIPLVGYGEHSQIRWDQDGLACHVEGSLETFEELEEMQLGLFTSGTSQKKLIAVSAEGLTTVLESHSRLLPGEALLALSCLPLHHCFGLILDFLLHLLSGNSLRRCRSAEALLHMTDGSIDCFSGVPVMIERLLADNAEKVLNRVLFGIIGGATVSPDLARKLKGSQFRVGYGLTEASPGLTIGTPGKFGSGYLGKALACQLRINSAGVLEFSGDNLALGVINQCKLKPFKKSWFPTGDRAIRRDEEFYYLGREKEAFKLKNGRFLDPTFLEHKLGSQLEESDWRVTADSSGGFSLEVYSSRSDLDLKGLLGGLYPYCSAFSRRLTPFERDKKGKKLRRTSALVA